MIQKDQKNGNAPVNIEREPEYEPNTNPSTGQHQQDIQDESTNQRNNKRPIQPGKTEPENNPGNDPREYNDGDPVEEKSPGLSSSL
jgi:hypothetical protein